MERLDHTFEDIFQGPVPVLTPFFIYGTTLILGLIVSLIIVSTRIMLPFLSPIILIIAGLIAILTEIIYCALVGFRFNYQDNEINELVDRVTSKSFTRNPIQVWTRKSLKPYAVSLVTPMHRAVVISTSMILHMKRMPDEAEVLLAEKIIGADASNRFTRYILSGIFMTITIFAFYNILAPMIPILEDGVLGYYLLLPLLMYPIGGYFIILIVGRSALWNMGEEVEFIVREWKKHPRLAEQQILASHVFSEDEEKKRLNALWKEDVRKRSERRLTRTLLCIGGLLIFNYVVFGYTLPLNYELASYYFVISIIISLALSFILFLKLRQTDNRELSNLWYDDEITTDTLWFD